jgi:hypothetical protein
MYSPDGNSFCSDDQSLSWQIIERHVVNLAKAIGRHDQCQPPRISSQSRGIGGLIAKGKMPIQ